jgi:hypothetical protein
MTDVRSLLESERDVEQDFVAGDRANPKGWSAALTMFHLVKWRERMRDALVALRDGGPHIPPPQNVDEFNDSELTGAADVPLSESSQRADALLTSLIELYETVGDRPLEWYRWSTTTEAILGNSYTHPRFHLVQYLKENEDFSGAVRLLERTASELRDASAPPAILGLQLYNLACLRVAEGRHDDAVRLLEQSVAMRPSLKAVAFGDPDLEPLRKDSRFGALFGSA